MIETEPDEYSLQQQQEEQQWEEHKKQLKELDKLLSEQNRISEKFDFLFKELKHGP